MSFLSAIGFLTILPIPERARNFNGKQVVYFPLVGLLIGGMLWAVDWNLSKYTYNEIRVVGDVLFLAIITGAFHLDGLADSADGLFSHRSKEKILEIMKDSRIGVMGVLALIFCLTIKMAGITGIKSPASTLWLILIPSLSRTAQVIGLTFMAHANPSRGLAQSFYEQNNWTALLFCPVPFALAFYLGSMTGIISIVFFALLVSGLFFFYHRMIGGITGDTLGATTEIVEALFFIIDGTSSFHLQMA